MVTTLKSPSQPTNTNHQSKITTNNSSANKINSLSSDYQQPQQHQLHIQINGGEPLKRRSGNSIEQLGATSQTTGKLLSPKTAKASQVTLSSASGPVTDL